MTARLLHSAYRRWALADGGVLVARPLDDRPIVVARRRRRRRRVPVADRRRLHGGRHQLARRPRGECGRASRPLHLAVTAHRWRQRRRAMGQRRGAPLRAPARARFLGPDAIWVNMLPIDTTDDGALLFCLRRVDPKGTVGVGAVVTRPTPEDAVKAVRPPFSALRGARTWRWPSWPAQICRPPCGDLCSRRPASGGAQGTRGSPSQAGLQPLGTSQPEESRKATAIAATATAPHCRFSAEHPPLCLIQSRAPNRRSFLALFIHVYLVVSWWSSSSSTFSSSSLPCTFLLLSRSRSASSCVRLLLRFVRPSLPLLLLLRPPPSSSASFSSSSQNGQRFFCRCSAAVLPLFSVEKGRFVC